MEPAKRQIKNPYNENLLLRNQMIIECLPNVKRIVYRIAIHLPQNAVEIDDLVNAGIVGLIHAIERYDPARNTKFMTYAAFRIKGAVLSELRSRDFLSRSNRKKIRELEKAYLKLEHKLGRDVEDKEAAEELGLNLEQFYQIKKMSGISFISFDELGYSSKEEKKNFMSCLVNNDAEDALTLAGVKEIRTAIAIAIDQLSEKEKLVISLYYLEELTMKETAKVLDVTESRVSQIHSKSIIHLREMLRKKGLIED